MHLPGFTPGEKAQNAVVAAMYLVAIMAVVGVVVMSLGIPGVVLSQDINDGGSSDSVASNASIEQTQTQPQEQDQDQAKESGWVTVTSSSESESSSSDSSASTQSTQRINAKQVQLGVLRNVMENSTRVRLISADIRQNEMYVRYTQSNMSQNEIRSGMGTVVGVFLGIVPLGADLQAIHGQIVDDSGQTIYTFTVERGIAIKYNNGELSNSQLRQQLIEALHPVNQTSATTSLI